MYQRHEWLKHVMLKIFFNKSTDFTDYRFDQLFIAKQGCCNWRIPLFIYTPLTQATGCQIYELSSFIMFGTHTGKIKSDNYTSLGPPSLFCNTSQSSIQLMGRTTAVLEYRQHWHHFALLHCHTSNTIWHYASLVCKRTLFNFNSKVWRTLCLNANTRYKFKYF
jgi:hypothetical protein